MRGIKKMQAAAAAAALVAMAMAPTAQDIRPRQTSAAPPRPRRPAVVDGRPALVREIAEHNAAVDAKRQAKKQRKQEGGAA